MTNHEKVLKLMISGRKEWYHTYDFVGNQFGIFLSHRGPARVSELAIEYPDMIQTDKSEDTYQYRFRFENSLVFLPKLPPKLAAFVKSELKGQGKHYQVERIVPQYVGKDTVRMVKQIQLI